MNSICLSAVCVYSLTLVKILWLPWNLYMLLSFTVECSVLKIEYAAFIVHGGQWFTMTRHYIKFHRNKMVAVHFPVHCGYNPWNVTGLICITELTTTCCSRFTCPYSSFTWPHKRSPSHYYLWGDSFADHFNDVVVKSAEASTLLKSYIIKVQI